MADKPKVCSKCAKSMCKTKTKGDKSMSFNKIIIIGNLGRDPELKYTPQGQEVCEFSVATSEKRKDSRGETIEETIWFRVSLWGKLAEVASKYLAKGRQVYIEGRLRTREWADKEGNFRTSLEVFGSELRLLGSRNDSNSSSDSNSYSKANAKPSTNSNSTAKTSVKAANPSKPTSTYSEDFNDNVTEDDIPF